MDWDKQIALESVDGDEELLQELINLFVDTMASDIDKIKEGQQNSNLVEVSNAAHSIKGSSVALGFEAIRALAEKVERDAKEGDESTLSDNIRELNTLLEKAKEIN